MAYYTGAATTIEQFVTALNSALTANGWTHVHTGEDIGGGSTLPDSGNYTHHVSIYTNGNQYAGLAFDNDPLGGCNQCRVWSAIGGYNPGAGNLYQQDDAAWCQHSYFIIPMAQYHIFVTAAYVYGVSEGPVGHFRHFGWGELEKQDSYVGGQFIASHYHAGSPYYYNLFPYSRYNSRSGATMQCWIGGDGEPNRWRHNYSTVFPNAFYGGSNYTDSLSRHLTISATNQFNRLTVLVPIYCSVVRSGGYESPAGVPPDIRLTVSTFTGVGEGTFTLGPDTWKVFPAGKVGSSSPELDAGSVAFAYKVT